MFCSSSPVFLCSKSSKYTHPVVILCSFLKKGTKLVCFEKPFLVKKNATTQKIHIDFEYWYDTKHILQTIALSHLYFSAENSVLNNNAQDVLFLTKFFLLSKPSKYAHPVVISCLLPQITYLFATFTNYIPSYRFLATNKTFVRKTYLSHSCPWDTYMEY